MKAILVNNDKSLRWDEVPNPVLAEDEVLIKVVQYRMHSEQILHFLFFHVYSSNDSLNFSHSSIL